MKLCLLLALVAASGLAAGEAERFFLARIEPILERRCYECHSRGHEVEGGLALDSRTGWQAGGDHGPAVRPHDLAQSPLIQAVRHRATDTAMPPREKLPAVEIALLETWVLLGAPDPRP